MLVSEEIKQEVQNRLEEAICKLCKKHLDDSDLVLINHEEAAIVLASNLILCGVTLMVNANLHREVLLQSVGRMYDNAVRGFSEEEGRT